MKAVLISIQPKWVEKIANGKKTIEVRKTAPKQVPFKAYIYCTFPKKPAYTLWLNRGTENKFLADGKVIGEFVCDNAEWMSIRDCDKACMTLKEAIDYGKGKKLYAWHISHLKIYDKPKELSEFRKPCPYGDLPCWICPSCDRDENDNLIQCFNTVSRPPQSYMYVEEL